jgi:hypothetical protein
MMRAAAVLMYLPSPRGFLGIGDTGKLKSRPGLRLMPVGVVGDGGGEFEGFEDILLWVNVCTEDGRTRWLDNKSKREVGFESIILIACEFGSMTLFNLIM